jgi:hypothetical protein
MYLIPNNRIACEPFESLAIQTTGKTFVTAKQKNSAYITRVVYPSKDCDDLLPGDSIFVKGTDMTLEWAKEVFEIGGKKVILVPLANALAFFVHSS